MFDVPELDNMLYMGLDRHSVVQCARVNKKWNKTVSPYVFQEIPRLPKKHHQEAFRRIVLEDYLQEQEKSPRPPSGPQPALAKYGHCGFWAWFWPTCSRHVTHLEFCAWGPRSVRSMSFGIGHMKYLEKAHFGRTETEDHVELEDDDLAVMIAAGAGAGQSWKDVRFKSTAKAGPAAFHALLQHASTLEELHFVRHAGSAATVALLATCQKLRVLAALDNKDRPNIQFPEVLAEDFIDWDAGTGMVRPWPCALTLETIQIKIRGMTRTSEAVNYVQLQGRVFQRLSRFVNLQVLWLGHDPKLTPVVKRRRQCATASDEDEDGDFYIDSEEDDDDEEEMEDPWSERQQDCLTMTWEAGVRPLARLEKLRELNLSRMDIEFEETVAHWIIMVLPNLRKIRGVENSVQAYSFLKQHHPKLIRY
ncbi:hypothetical protein BGZ52_013352 [Haplosporangium bisporale]|nr:hypothetical protein BGZ52_013352 [Haplosporangium bisporale]